MGVSVGINEEANSILTKVQNLSTTLSSNKLVFYMSMLRLCLVIVYTIESQCAI